MKRFAHILSAFLIVNLLTVTSGLPIVFCMNNGVPCCATIGTPRTACEQQCSEQFAGSVETPCAEITTSSCCSSDEESLPETTTPDATTPDTSQDCSTSVETTACENSACQAITLDLPEYHAVSSEAYSLPSSVYALAVSFLRVPSFDQPSHAISETEHSKLPYLADIPILTRSLLI